MPTSLIIPAQKRAEARTRYYTRDEAQRVGWDVRHPAKGGRFLEEQELVDYFPLLKPALGNERPDFAAIANDGKLRAVIECKGDTRDLEKATAEAREYADTINRIKGFDVRVAVGVAGTPDRYVQTRGYFLRDKEWVSLSSHGYPLTQIPTLTELQVALENDNGTTDVQLPNEREFFDAAIRLSRIMRLAKIEEAIRPKIIGAIILALYHSDFSLDQDSVLEHINVNVKASIKGFVDVPQDRREFLTQTLTLSTEADRLRTVIVDIVHQLERLNVRSIMRSGVDFLGQFYETFLRYGQDAKKLGIVFTPRHITRFCAELADVKLGMKVYDPAAGTGGFLVAAFDRMMKEATTKAARETVKSSLYGSDTNSTVWALAVLNMFFRGDGKSHIVYGSCFDQPQKTHLFQRALLNPPFNQDGEPETEFIDHALEALQPGGVLAVVVKSSVIVDGDLSKWRKTLVENHHVLAAISLPEELFYPTAAPTSILLVKAHAPDLKRGTFLAKIFNDGYKVSKKRRVPVSGSQLDNVLQLFRQYLNTGTIDTVPNLARVVDRGSIANGEEICAEQWLPSSPFGMVQFEERRQELMRQMSLAVANYPDASDELIPNFEQHLAEQPGEDKPKTRAQLQDWFSVHIGKSDGVSNYPGGGIPYISSGHAYNGIVELVLPLEEEIYNTPHVTVSAFGHAYIQPWRFCARGNGGSAVRVLEPRFEMTAGELIWMVGQINAQRWRFHYGRMGTVDRIKQLAVDAPPVNLPPIMGLEAKLRNFRRGLRVLGSGQSGDTTLEQRFASLALMWREGRKPSSSVAVLSLHPAYQQIIGMGESVLPLIFAELERKADHWFWALNSITGANPVPKASQGRLTDMAQAWLSWGKAQGFTW